MLIYSLRLSLSSLAVVQRPAMCPTPPSLGGDSWNTCSLRTSPGSGYKAQAIEHLPGSPSRRGTSLRSEPYVVGRCFIRVS